MKPLISGGSARRAALGSWSAEGASSSHFLSRGGRCGGRRQRELLPCRWVAPTTEGDSGPLHLRVAAESLGGSGSGSPLLCGDRKSLQCPVFLADLSYTGEGFRIDPLCSWPPLTGGEGQ